jgi:hypothetical protein
MALYLVKAKPKRDVFENLYSDLISGQILKMRPFGKILQYILENALIDVRIILTMLYRLNKTIVLLP